MRLEIVRELNVGSAIGQCRAVPVRLKPGGAPGAFLVVYGADFDVDPYVEMFFFPTDTLKMALFAADGALLWRRDLGRGVVPGLWFCPVFAFDLDGDGAEEIWFVGNDNAQHPLGLSHYCLVRLDGRTGERTGEWPWPNRGGDQSLSHTFRNFILGGVARGEPVFVTAQGTYGSMFLQAWRPDLTLRWELAVAREAPGARGSHMCALLDINDDGVDELMWGERCIELDGGRELFCADREGYRGHSDIVQPLLGADGRWTLFTCRESDADATPRVILFDHTGRCVWGDVERGHIDMGWVARLGDEGEPVAMAIRIGKKSCGPDGRFHQDVDEFAWVARTGRPYPSPCSLYRTLPVDLNGDGRHELVRGAPSGDGEVLSHRGERIGSVGGAVALASKFLDLPGEQLLSYHADGTLRIWADPEARDSPAALARYAHPFYALNQRLTATGYNQVNLGGL
jgi:hypothetical protein